MTIQLKYPVVLVHGVAAKDHTLFWGRIPQVLRQNGIDVFWGNVDAWGSIETNALSLQKTVDSVLETCRTDKINLIAHSKGGIDSRYLISTLNYAPKVASLTTISTPHRGVEIVDYILRFKQVHTPLSKSIAKFIGKLYGDRHPNPYKLATEVSTDQMKLFNENNPDMEGVYYSSCCSALRNEFDELSCWLTYRHIRKVNGHNDGIVSAKSARWGENFYVIPGVSHAEVVDIKRKKISGIDIPGEYLKIVVELSKKGF